ncbi:SusC/RagA family TonB-linked outer membrane protein [Echinicola marina]|uniref:SusC/RagA family TonB-linked outer membrane protein n=1 Tax=Echinicola marina TaxID=2859768 RepID=UPI001CF6ACC7|nr:SusC/RagA family TonB-linked outer membrane protein [Echinicola marina]UCS94330.1 SusC/RagA family TonB-linked outer membrane protein [Echinicola marina]
MKKTLLLHAGSMGSTHLFSGDAPCFLLSIQSKVPRLGPRLLYIMKWSLFITGIICCTAATLLAGEVKGQSALDKEVSIEIKNQLLKDALDEISTRAEVTFVYSDKVAASREKVNVIATNRALRKVLDDVFLNLPFGYQSLGNEIVIKHDPKKDFSPGKRPVPTQLEISMEQVRGVVLDPDGYPLPGATIQVKGSNWGTVTDENGEFILNNVQKGDILIISMIGFEKIEIEVRNFSENMVVPLKEKVSELDEAVVIAYGTTTRRLNTGSIGRITAREIEKQPVLNPLGTLQGRIPGLVISESSGVSGAQFNVEIRGRNTIDDGISNNSPLFIVDGVPFGPGNDNFNQLASAANNPSQISSGGFSPLSLINPSYIESIEVLKDADATAIYGSRGANGVILITTKKGKSGATNVNINVYTGAARAGRTVNMLNTSQYIEMRKEAFANDGVEPTNSTAPDLLIWDTTRFTDWRKELIGGTARVNNIQASISGGSDRTQFLLGGTYRKETTVYPGDFSNKRAAANFSLTHRSSDDRLNARLSVNYASLINNIVQSDLTRYLNLPPNFPALLDDNGDLNWSEKGVPFANMGIVNPLSYLFQTYEGKTENLISNLNLEYKIAPFLSFRTSLGYNTTYVDEITTRPSTSLDPSRGLLPSASFANNALRSWIAEPQVELYKSISHGELNVLLGATWQSNDSDATSLTGRNYNSDLLLHSIQAAGTVSAQNSNSQYKYTAAFARINYNWENKYILNLTGRRDGSSRFGPNNRFSNFGAVGGAWLFSNEPFGKKLSPVVSFGKIRGSYGITGNDQIGDYLYLDTWGSTYNTVNGNAGLYPTKLFNPDYQWEKNSKIEATLELGLFSDQVFFSATWYRNRSSNQLVNYPLPYITGFNRLVDNLNALIENRGFEFIVESKNIETPGFSWSTSLNLTAPKNKLLAFPNLETSPYSSRFEIGHSLNLIKGYQYIGVNPETGVYEFVDVNNDGSLSTGDYQPLGNTDPKFYGGISNSLHFRNLQIDFLLEFRKQTGVNYFRYFNTYRPGSAINQPTIINERWKQPGDITEIQKLTRGAGASDANNASSYMVRSDKIYSDASFIRLKNVSLSYLFPQKYFRETPFSNARVYAQAQNLLTFTNYYGDPETQDIQRMPPMRMITLGIQFNVSMDSLK